MKLRRGKWARPTRAAEHRASAQRLARQAAEMLLAMQRARHPERERFYLNLATSLNYRAGTKAMKAGIGRIFHPRIK